MHSLQKVLENHANVVENGYTAQRGLRYRSYAISTLRGGVGKSTLAFNLAFEMSRQRSILIADLCAQCNLTETLMSGDYSEVTILNSLQPKLLVPAFCELSSYKSLRVSA